MKDVVLLWGLAEDSPTARIADELRRLQVPVAWVDQQEVLSHRIELEVSRDVRGTLHLSGSDFELADIRGAYLRPYDFRTLEAVRRIRVDDPAFRRCAAFEETLQAWAEVTPATVMNRFSATASNGSKPLQAESIRRHGFAVPDTLVTTDRDAALAFWEKHGSVIYKSISSRRSVVARLKDTDRKRLAKVRYCPTQFQRFIAGTDYRVHVVGDQIHVCRVRSMSTDYRYDHTTTIEVADVPASVAERCYRLTRGLGLELSGVDLRETPDGEWFCFEVNPSPGFTYYEDATGLPLAASIASALSGSPGSPTRAVHFRTEDVRIMTNI